MKKSNIPQHTVAPGFTPVCPVVTKILDLAAVRSLVDKPNYDTKKFADLARARSHASVLCEHHKGESEAEVNVIATKEDESYQFFIPGESETFVLAAKFFSAVRRHVHGSVLAHG